MKTLDLHFPASAFDYAQGLGHFYMIYPSDHEVAQKITLDTLVQIVAWNDDYYEDIIESGERFPTDKQDSEGFIFLDVVYLRECAVRNVDVSEWKFNWGAANLEEWTAVSKKLPDQPVKIICLGRPNPNLSRFNSGGYLDARKI